MAEETASSKKRQERHDKMLETAKKRWRIAESSESEMRELALDDIRFAEGDQWPAEMRDLRQRQNRPCLTINRIPQFVQHITNEQRQNPISIQVDPIGDGDEDTADVFEGLIRHIQNQSNADEAYSNGFDYAVKGGWGYWRVVTDYADEFSFEQEIYIKKVENPFSVYLDPGGSEGDASDVGWGFVICDYTKEQYEEKYPDSKYTTGETDWSGTGNGWVQDDTIRVAEYFYKDMREEEIVQMSDGQVYLKRVLPEPLPAGISVVQRRTTQVPFVKWALINNQEVLDEKEWAGKWIPIVKVIGQMTNIDGKRVYKGIVRDARDPQQQFNYMETAATEAIALAPKAPFLGTKEMFQGYEKEWQTMNITNRPFLRFNHDPMAPGLVPQRQTAEPPIQAMMLAVRQASDDLKATAGIYDAALGAGANDVSGKAILARQEQSNISAYHFADNLKRSVRQTGRIIVDLIPFVYNTPERVIRIVKEDGTGENVKVNVQPNADGQLPPGVANVYDLTTGKYDITISTGPTYQTKRQEAVDTQLELLKVNPNLFPIIGDIVVGNMDIPGSREISSRLKTQLPPAIAALDQKQAGISPEAQTQIVNLQTQLQQATQAAQAMQEDLKHDLSKTQMELESNERIAFEKLNLEREKLQTQIAVAEINAKNERADADAQRELDMLQQQMDQAHEAAMQAVEQQHQQEMAQQQPAPVQ